MSKKRSETPPGLLRAREAAALLGIKRETLYAYVARGWLRSVGSSRAQGKFYAKEELERLRARHDARAGHTAVAAGAMQWGAPILDSAITGIDERGPHYRGTIATQLVREEVSFERVAELLWTGTLPATTPPWKPFKLRLPPRALLPADALLRFVHARAIRDLHREKRGESYEHTRARRLLPSLAQCWNAHRCAHDTHSLAERVVCALRLEHRERATKIVNAALVLLADHELNVSAFATRVAASAGADLYACLCAGIAAASGPKHAAAATRAEALLGESETTRQRIELVRKNTAQGIAFDGFHHPLYPQGDPRATALFEVLQDSAPKHRTLTQVKELTAMVSEYAGVHANIDLALATATRVLDAPKETGSFLFMLGRCAGWIAHLLEQRQQPTLLRPRARYTGKTPAEVPLLKSPSLDESLRKKPEEQNA